MQKYRQFYNDWLWLNFQQLAMKYDPTILRTWTCFALVYRKITENRFNVIPFRWITPVTYSSIIRIWTMNKDEAASFSFIRHYLKLDIRPSYLQTNDQQFQFSRSKTSTRKTIRQWRFFPHLQPDCERNRTWFCTKRCDSHTVCICNHCGECRLGIHL